MKSLAIISLLLISTTPLLAASSFNEVRNVVFGENPMTADIHINNEIKSYEKNHLPHYEVTSDKFIRGGINRLLDRATRTLKDTDDYYPRLEKLLHSNGACFSGTWNINKANPYSGYFKNGSTGLFIGRASTALSETERGDARGFGLAGKIFPTTDKDSVVQTANFFLVDVLMGTQRNRFMDVGLTNKPSLGFRPSVIRLALKIMKVFKGVDSDPIYRQVYPISEMGLAVGEKVRTPKFMMIKTDKSVARNDDTDFRDELNIKKNHSYGIKFNIYVNDTSNKQDDGDWVKIGYIQADESAVSYGCDRRLHFAHPKFK
ncbi:hypothetical protein SHI21_08650 [Bacteriovorax sp. PP10]|uniref:Uncharacterized protein n=1 Tax=Bacteriovorax antarcticus TaxID=3088717 RepID=A0ABU5VT93_9BACT|nr:hypothetical protein [Bacteriovorax sp. PP10]MEA9356269.1 hypothetical protein [Bacteriovorax sp. PP10]